MEVAKPFHITKKLVWEVWLWVKPSDGGPGVDGQAMRGIAVGRKNWLFCGSEYGGQLAAVIYSLIETCKRQGVEPFEYLREMLDRTGPFQLVGSDA